MLLTNYTPAFIAGSVGGSIIGGIIGCNVGFCAATCLPSIDACMVTGAGINAGFIVGGTINQLNHSIHQH